MKNRKHAQSASELAIFGAILMFVIGIIIRSGFNASHAMNAQLKALRYALSESEKTSLGDYVGTGRASRSTASITLIEDRLSIDAGQKFGTRDRIVMGAAASGTLSEQLFYPIDFDEKDNLPILDVIINGQRFPFTTAGFKSIDLDVSLPACALDPPGVNPRGGLCWEPTCADVVVGCRFIGAGAGTNYDSDGSGNCISVTPGTGDSGLEREDKGCAVLYKIVGNFANSEDWDVSCDECFDLDFDGTPDVDAADRGEFNWQWIRVVGVDNKVLEKDGELLGALAGLEGISVPLPGSAGESVNTVLDADGDLKEETIQEMVTDENGVIITLNVLDNQEGDIDLSRDDRDDILAEAEGLDPLEKLGLGDDIQMFSFTKDGTLLQIEEGKLLDPGTGQFVRTTSRQQHVDIIQRGFRLSKNTGLFCDGATPKGTVRGLPTPVEVCCDSGGCGGGYSGCFDGGATELTCMDTEQLIIFIRSRIEDLRGRRWVTRFDP